MILKAGIRKEIKMDINCVNCDFWAGDRAANGKPLSLDGFCRVKPPSFPEEGEDGSMSSWPPVFDHDWCGEFKPKGWMESVLQPTMIIGDQEISP